MRKYCATMMLGNRWQGRWCVVDSTKLRYWSAKNQSGSRQLAPDGGEGKEGVNYEYSVPSASYDLRCVEKIRIVGEEEDHEFIIEFNEGSGVAELEEEGKEDREKGEWSTLRLRGPNRAVFELWVEEISHRVFTIALMTALLRARKIVQKKVDDEKRKKEEKEMEEKIRKKMEEERKQREEVSSGNTHCFGILFFLLFIIIIFSFLFF